MTCGAIVDKGCNVAQSVDSWTSKQSFNQISLTITYYIHLRSFCIPVLYSLEYRVGASNSVLFVQGRLDWLVLLFGDDDCERYSWSYDPEKYIKTLNYHISKAKIHTCIAINKLSLNYKLSTLNYLRFWKLSMDHRNLKLEGYSFFKA